VEGFQSVEHACNVPLSEVEPGSFFQPFVPQFMPQNGHADQFFTDLWNKGNQSIDFSTQLNIRKYHHSLLDQNRTVLAHALQNLVGGIMTSL